MMKKLPAIVPFPKRKKDDAVTAQLKSVVRRGVGYTLIGTRPFEGFRFQRSLYPNSCHSAIHQVIEILVCQQMGVSLDIAISHIAHQRPCYYRREMTGGRYDCLKDIRAIPILGGVLYQMLTGQRFVKDFSGVEIFSAMSEIVKGITSIMNSWDRCQVLTRYPLPQAMETMDAFPPLYLSGNTIWTIASRQTELKRIDLFYPIVAYFLARQQSASMHCQCDYQQVGVINPYTGQYAVLEMSRFSPTVYGQIEQLVAELSQT